MEAALQKFPVCTVHQILGKGTEMRSEGHTGVMNNAYKI